MVYIIITFAYSNIFDIYFDSWYENSSQWVSVANYLSIIILGHMNNQANARSKENSFRQINKKMELIQLIKCIEMKVDQFNNSINNYLSLWMVV